MDKLKEVCRKAAAHWTEQNYADFVYRISSDFMLQIASKLEKEGIKYSEFAAKWGVSPARVSQIINDPGNLELTTTVQCARALGMKVALVAYEDGDTENESGPVNSEIFSACWQKAGAPRDLFELNDTLRQMQTVMMVTAISAGKLGQPITNGSTPTRGRFYLGATADIAKEIPLEVSDTHSQNTYSYVS